jgi:hypothetical protein
MFEVMEGNRTFGISPKTDSPLTEKDILEGENPGWKVFKLTDFGPCSMANHIVWQDEDFMQSHGLE